MTKKIRLYQPFGDLGCQRPEEPAAKAGAGGSAAIHTVNRSAAAARINDFISGDPFQISDY